MKSHLITMLLAVVLLSCLLFANAYAIRDKKDTVTVGEVVSYTNKNAYTDFDYSWDIISGSNCIRIVSGSNSKTCTVEAVTPGSAELKATAVRSGRRKRTYEYSYIITVIEPEKYVVPQIEQSSWTELDYDIDAVPSNMFIGTINGEKVIAYLDYTYATYYHDGLGKDIDATFVAFDDDGNPQHSIGIRLDSKTHAGVYNINAKVIDYVSVHLFYNSDTYEFKDYYRIVEGAKEWTVKFDEVDFESGVVKGRVNAVLTPSRYNRAPYPTRSTVNITGNFEFQTKTIHPYMEEYRTEYKEYAEKHKVDFVQSIGSSTFSLRNCA